jgi:hypothetical protein
MVLMRKLNYSEKTHTSATVATTNPTWIDMRLNPNFCGKMLATDFLSCGIAGNSPQMSFKI